MPKVVSTEKVLPCILSQVVDDGKVVFQNEGDSPADSVHRALGDVVTWASPVGGPIQSPSCRSTYSTTTRLVI